MSGSFSPGSVTVPGSNTYALFNDSNVLGADAGFAYNKTNKALALGGATVTASAPALDVSQTFNNAGVTFTGARFNFTDNASASGSLLVDFQLNSSSIAYISKQGGMRVANGQMSGGTGIGFSGTGHGFYSPGGSNFYVAISNSAVAEFITSGIGLGSNSLSWGTFGTTQTLFLRQWSSNILAQYNSTNAQAFYLFNTYTSSTNNEYGKLAWESNDLKIGTVKGSGGGSARGLTLVTDNTARLSISSAGNMIFTSPSAPATSSDTGTLNEIRWDSSYIYICTASNTWKRVALSTW